MAFSMDLPDMEEVQEEVKEEIKPAPEVQAKEEKAAERDRVQEHESASHRQ